MFQALGLQRFLVFLEFVLQGSTGKQTCKIIQDWYSKYAINGFSCLCKTSKQGREIGRVGGSPSGKRSVRMKRLRGEGGSQVEAWG